MKHIFILAFSFLFFTKTYTQNSPIIINVKQPIAKVEPTMWGIFFEDINLGADGGIYAELIKNRSFEFYKPLMGWRVKQNKFNEGSVLVINRKEENKANPRYLQITKNTTVDSLSLTNEGFRGMGIKKGLRYDFSMLYRLQKIGLVVHIELQNNNGKIIGQTVITPKKTNGKTWSKEAISFVATDSAMKGKLHIRFEGAGTMDIDLISLFPADTWKERPGGMRKDMIQLLADLKPGFLRFPGGCIVEGFDLSLRYQWKKTLGSIESRQLIINRWNNEFAHRPTPDYFQTFGLGFYEYFQLAEDIGAAPLPILNCGMACQFNSAEVAPLNELDPYVQDALDLIEFANGSVNSTWGKVRAAMGHPKPFNLQMMGVGNENWGTQYLERLQVFTKAIKAKYPNFKLIASSGTDPNGERFDLLNTTLRKNKADIIDEHYYRKPNWFLENAARYDNYPRNGSKVFAGEYAAQSDKIVSVDNKNNMQTAIAEAAFMTGLERNAAVVNLASYAPLFAHIDGWQWTPDLIWVNNLQSYGTANYYVQKLFSTNKGTNVVLALQDGKPLTGQNNLYLSSVIDSNTKEVIVKIVNANAKVQKVNITLNGLKNSTTNAIVTVLQSDDVNSINSFEKPENIAPKETSANVENGVLNYEVAANSFVVVRVKY
jgi:alpha-L-arabinofuranosidase